MLPHYLVKVETLKMHVNTSSPFTPFREQCWNGVEVWCQWFPRLFTVAVLEPILEAEKAEDYLATHVNPTLLHGLSELCKHKPANPVVRELFLHETYHLLWRFHCRRHLLLLSTPFVVQVSSSVLWRCWLGGRNGIRPVRNWVVEYWCGHLSGARCRFAYDPADATSTHFLLLQ